MPFPVSPQIITIGAILFIAMLIALWFQLRPGRRRRGRRKNYWKAFAAGTKKVWKFLSDQGARIARRYKRERSGEWGRIQDEHLLREPACRACGYKGKKVQVHHIKPFHLHPDLELEPDNLITLCQARGKYHHMLLGHLNYWSSYNADIEEDIKLFYGMSSKQIKANIEWKKKVALRPKHKR